MRLEFPCVRKAQTENRKRNQKVADQVGRCFAGWPIELPNRYSCIVSRPCGTNMKIRSTGNMLENDLYEKLRSTAIGSVMATSPKFPGSNEPDSIRFHSYLAPNFHMSWGHEFFVSEKPGLQGFVDSEQFLSHQSGIAKNLKMWSVAIKNTCVDMDT